MLQTRVFQPRLRDFHAVNGYLPPRGALRALELGWQRLVPCVSNLRRSAVCAIGGDAISGSAPRPSGTGGLQTLCWRKPDSNSRSPWRLGRSAPRKSRGNSSAVRVGTARDTVSLQPGSEARKPMPEAYRVLSPDEIERLLVEHRLYLETEYSPRPPREFCISRSDRARFLGPESARDQDGPRLSQPG
jgi:hypothetical protein